MKIDTMQINRTYPVLLVIVKSNSPSVAATERTFFDSRALVPRKIIDSIVVGNKVYVKLQTALDGKFNISSSDIDSVKKYQQMNGQM